MPERENIRVTYAMEFDAPADLPPVEQLEAVAADVGRLLDPDSTTGVELVSAEPVEFESESQIYSGEARRAWTRPGFDWFTVQRCAEWKGDRCEAIGWNDSAPWAKGEAPDSIFWTVYGARVGEGSQAIGDYRSRASALLMAEALADGREVHAVDSMLPGFRVTWETVTAESAAEGDAAARGFVLPHSGALEPVERARGFSAYDMPLREALEALALSREPWRVLEVVEGSDGTDSAPWLSVVWNFSDSGPAQELPGGDSVLSATFAIHFPENITPASRARIARLIRAAL